jgi:hypothetical protein
LSIAASASDPSSLISRVRFFVNGAVIGEDATSPYSVGWSGAAAGNYSLTAQALGANGVIATAAAVPIALTSATSTPPPPPPPPTQPGTPGSVQLVSPVNGAVFVNQGTIPLAVAVSNPSAISKVELYAGTKYIGAAAPPSYTGKWGFVPSGTHVLTARAYAANGAVLTSSPVTVRVTSPPSVRLTSPLAGMYPTPATLTLTAAASDLDGTIARVEFFEGSRLLGQTTTAPHTYVWKGAGPGTYVVTAKAYDNLGLATASAAVSVTLNAPPSVQLISPREGSTSPNQGTVLLEAAASDPGGRIQKVEFYRGTSIIGTAYTSPYRFYWSYVGTGRYAVTAKAYDDKGMVSWSAPVNITVTSAAK